MNTVVESVLAKIKKQSEKSRAEYLAFIDRELNKPSAKGSLSCGNLAHAIAGNTNEDKLIFKTDNHKNLAIVSAYNDMLSAHKPYEHYPEQIRQVARSLGCSAQVAGGVPAMCDGVTQGQAGMELSLFSRDQIAASTAIALSHNVFDAALYLGICDKIVPGLLIAALRFGHLPAVFVPAGPMASGLPNKEKAKVREDFATGKVDEAALLEAETQSYHSPGTCTFYGTANTNQILLEAMGLQLAGASFVHPQAELRQALNTAACEKAIELAQADSFLPIAHLFDERSVINAIVALLASGGSTNLSIHLIAIARAAGILIDWNDFAELSKAVPLLARVYPNGQADINHFHQAGGTTFLFQQLLDLGLMFGDASSIGGSSFADALQEPNLEGDKLIWQNPREVSGDAEVLAAKESPFADEGGLKLIEGNLGRSIVKISAVAEAHRYVKAPAVVFHSQADFQSAFANGDLNKDCVVVLRFQGPAAIGMPELHKLTPAMGHLQKSGFSVALVTDGRMSGASGSIPAAIHLSPEALSNGNIAKILDGDLIELDCNAGKLNLLVNDDDLAKRNLATCDLSAYHEGCGRELFAPMRANVSSAEEGASIFSF